MNPILKEIDFRDLRHLDHHVRLPMWYDALKTIFLVNAALALGYAIFYELIQLCLALDISGWWAAAGFVAMYALFLRKHWKGAQWI